MKKIIAILVVLSVMFVAFAESDIGSTALDLKATVAPRLYHGFVASSTVDFDNANAVKSALSESGSGNLLATENNAVSVNPETPNNTEQTIGYYGIWTTGNATASVEFTVQDLKTTVGSTNYYVPYLLKMTSVAGSGATLSIANLGNNGVVGSAASTANLNRADVIKLEGSGLRWQILDLAVIFDGQGNIDAGLPEGVYTSTITVEVTTTS